MQHVTRYQVDGDHGWYVCSDSEVVLAPGDSEVWPRLFETYCRRTRRGPQDLAFRSPEDELAFLHDVRANRGTVAQVDAATTVGAAG